MASNHTQNYGLCQWEATDQVLRTDFNEDNQRIDAAIKDLRNDVISGTLLLEEFHRIDEKIAALERRIAALEG